MYFCKSCGSEYAYKEAVICVKCGVKKGDGRAFCHSCGKPMQNESATVCLNCGVGRVPASSGASGVSGVPGVKSKLLAGLLGIFLGCFGVHNFYLGYTNKAIIQLILGVLGAPTLGITALASGIWGIVEAIYILTGKIDQDADGNPLGE